MLIKHRQNLWWQNPSIGGFQKKTYLAMAKKRFRVGFQKKNVFSNGKRKRFRVGLTIPSPRHKLGNHGFTTEVPTAAAFLNAHQWIAMYCVTLFYIFLHFTLFYILHCFTFYIVLHEQILNCNGVSSFYTKKILNCNWMRYIVLLQNIFHQYALFIHFW